MRQSLPLLAIIASAAPARAQFPRVRDSAGVRIVENAARAKAPTTFKLSDQPTSDVGGLKDKLDDELSTNGAALTQLRFSDGRSVVADETRLRFFDAAGKQERVVGRRGQGPGEFQFIETICRTRGDTIVLNDTGNSRVTVLDRTGTMVREIPVGRTPLLQNGCLDDGTFLLQESQQPVGAPATTKLVRRRLDGTVVGSAGEFPGGTLDVFIGLLPMYAAHGQKLYFNDTKVSEVRLYSPQGMLAEIIRTTDPIEKTTASERAAMRPKFTRISSDEAFNAQAAERLRTAPRPEEWPSYGRMLIDPDGRLWLQAYQKDFRSPTPIVWTAFDSAGRLLGRLTLPAPLKRGDPRVIAFTSGGVLIGQDDADGAHHVTTYALVPAGAKR